MKTDFSRDLTRQLREDSDWKAVHVEGVHILFLRADKQYKELAHQGERRLDNTDIRLFVKQLLDKDPSFKNSLLTLARTFAIAGDLDRAISIMEAGLEIQPRNIAAWKTLLRFYDSRGRGDGAGPGQDKTR